MASAQQLFTQQTLVEGNTKLEITFRVTNTSALPFTFGNSDLVFNTNSVSLNRDSITQVISGNGIWDASNSPRFYGGLLVSFFPVEGYYRIGIRRSALDSISPPAEVVLQPGQTGTICTIRILISDCQGYSDLFFDQSAENSVLTDFGGNAIDNNLLSFTNESFALAPPAPASTVNVTGASNPLYPTRFCVNQTMQVSVAAAGAISYRFYRRPRFGDTVSLSSWQSSNTLLLSGANFSDQDSVTAYFKTAYCTYKVTGGLILTIEDSVREAPTAASSQRNIYCINPGNSDFSINPLFINNLEVISYQWRIDPVNAGTIVGSSTGTKITVDWNNNYTGYVNVFVKGVNTCGSANGYELRFVNRIDGGAPLALGNITTFSQTPGFRCITDTAITNFTVPAAANAEMYVWRIWPSNAYKGITYVPNPGTDSLNDYRTIKVVWNSFFQGSTVKIVCYAINSCGSGDTSSNRVLNINNLPKKMQSLAIDLAAADSNRKCQPINIRQVDSVTVTATLDPASVLPAITKGYRWSVQSFVGRYNGQTISPQIRTAVLDTSDRNARTFFKTNTASITLKLNPLYYGYVRVICAAASSSCKFNYPYPSRGALGVAFDDTSGIGETDTLEFFVKPFAQKGDVTLTPVPLIRGLNSFRSPALNSVTGDTINMRYNFVKNNSNPAIGPLFANKVYWNFVRIPNYLPDNNTLSPDPSLAFRTVNFDAADANTISVITLPNPVPGDYFLRAYGVNDCGGRDTSRVFRIRVASQAPFPVDTVVYKRRSNDTIFSPDPYRVCQQTTPTALTLRVVTKSDAAFQTVTGRDTAFLRQNYQNVANSFKWVVTPRAAGTIDTLVLRTDTAGRRQSYGFPSDTTVIVFRIAPSYYGPLNIKVIPINAYNFSDTNLQNAGAFVINTKVFRSPSAYAGAQANIPTLVTYILGGGPTAFSSTPTSTVYNGTLANARIRWNMVDTTTTPRNINLFSGSSIVGIDTVFGDSINPIIFANSTRLKPIQVTVTDSVKCYNSSTVTVTVQNSINVNLKVMLEGAANATGTSMHDSLYNAVDGLGNKLLARFEKSVTTPAPDVLTTMLPGYRLPTNLPAGSRIVDRVKISLFSDPLYVSELGSGGYAYLLQDGTLLAYEEGRGTFGRVLFAGAPRVSDTLDGVFVKVIHRNHFPLTSAQRVRVSYNKAAPTSGLNSEGFIDLTSEQNVSATNINNGINYKKLGSVLSEKVVMIAGDVKQDNKAEINALDVTLVGEAARTAGTVSSYDINDVNVNGKLSSYDQAVADRNSLQIFFTTISR